MPRIPRHQLVRPEGTYHVIMRGNNREVIFHDTSDFTAYLALLATELRMKSFVLYHYVLMGNHVHMILRAHTPLEFSSSMRRLHLHYSLYHAERYARTGHLWESRFKSYPIEDDGYLLTCGIYVGLNPVRAGLVADPAAYPWSSHGAYVSDHHDPLIALDPAYLDLSPEPAARRAAYESLVRMWMDRPVPQKKAKQFFSGSSFASLHPEGPKKGQVLSTRKVPVPF